MSMFNSVGTMHIAFNSGILWMNFILVAGVCGVIDYTVLAFNTLLVTGIHHSLKIIPDKDNISQNYIGSLPDTLKNLLIEKKEGKIESKAEQPLFKQENIFNNGNNTADKGIKPEENNNEKECQVFQVKKKRTKKKKKKTKKAKNPDFPATENNDKQNQDINNNDKIKNGNVPINYGNVKEGSIPINNFGKENIFGSNERHKPILENEENKLDGLDNEMKNASNAKPFGNIHFNNDINRSRQKKTLISGNDSRISQRDHTERDILNSKIQ